MQQSKQKKFYTTVSASFDQHDYEVLTQIGKKLGNLTPNQLAKRHLNTLIEEFENGIVDVFERAFKEIPTR